jgi:hypothetical protein
MHGATVRYGIPYINGKPAIKDENVYAGFEDVYAPWRCPECNAFLSKEHLICLNACHLSAASFRRFQRGLAEAAAEVEKKKKAKE